MYIAKLFDYLNKLSLLKAIFLLSAISILSHSTYLFNGFTWLDHIDIENRNAITPINQLHTTFIKPYSATHFYRPVVSIVHSLDFTLYQNQAAGYHFTNLILHTLVAIAALFILYHLTQNQAASLIGVLVFTVHPATALSVGSISYRTDLLATLFTLLAIIFYLAFVQHNHSRDLILSSLFFLLGLFSKETVILWLPTVILLLNIRRQTRVFNHPRKCFLVTPYVIAVAIYYFLRQQALTSIWQFTQIPLSASEYLGTRLASFVDTFLYYFLPMPAPPISDAVTIYAIQSPKAGLGIMLIIFVGYLLYRLKSHTDAILIILLLTITFLPSFNIVPLPRFISPHYLYFSATVLALSVAALIKYFQTHNKLRSRNVLILIFIWYCAAFITTIREGGVFQNDLTLFEHEIRQDPNFKEGRLYTAAKYMQVGEVDRAIDQYKAILAPNAKVIAFSDRTAAGINLAYAYLQTNRIDDAEQVLLEASSNAHGISQTQIAYNLSLIYFSKHDFSAVIKMLSPVHRQLPPSASLILAEAYLKTDQQPAAQQVLDSISSYRQHPTYREHFVKLESQMSK